MSSPSPPLLDALHRIVTPESVEFEFALSGLYARFLAWLLDRAIILTAFTVFAVVAGLVLGAWDSLGSILGVVLYFLFDWGYMIAFEALWAGQTPGKRALGLRVLQVGGVRVGFEQVVLRNLARAVDSLPILYCVGGVAALLSVRHQRLGDLLAGTVVVRERRLGTPKDLRAPGVTAPVPEPLLPQRVPRLSQDARALVVDAVRRRDELDLEARLRLFEPLSAHLEAAMGLARPSHLSAEKWCLWIAAELVRPRGGPPVAQ